MSSCYPALFVMCPLPLPVIYICSHLSHCYSIIDKVLLHVFSVLHLFSLRLRLMIVKTSYVFREQTTMTGNGRIACEGDFISTEKFIHSRPRESLDGLDGLKKRKSLPIIGLLEMKGAFRLE